MSSSYSKDISRPQDARVSDDTSVKLNIGALAKATGVPANTLRTWERRYGFPTASRTEGGQRLYDHEVVERVRAVARAIDRGFRPANVMRASLAELNAMLGDGPAPARAGPRRVAPVGAGDIDAWVEAAAALDGETLEQGFRSRAAQHGVVEFLERWAVPFLVAVGVAWEQGRIDPFQEHFASERLRDFLAATWRPLADANTGPVAVCAGLPGDQHVLGLHMVAALAAMTGWRVIYLGGDTPLQDVEACARHPGVRALLISISPATARTDAAWSLGALRARVPADVAIVVGGGGAPEGVDGVTRLPELPALVQWLEARRAG